MAVTVPVIVPPELRRLGVGASAAALQRAAVDVVQHSGQPAGGARPPKFGSLVSTRYRGTSNGFQIESTGEVAAGAEYGGQRRPKRTYLRKGRSVRRRTTMQFLPFNPKGYGITPALKAGMSGIRQRIADAVGEAATK